MQSVSSATTTPQTVDMQAVWPIIRNTVQKVITCTCDTPSDRQEYRHCFQHIYNLCTAKPEALYTELYNEIKQFLKAYIQDLRQGISQVDSKDMLLNYHEAYAKHRKGLDDLDTLFVHFNNQYVDRNNFDEIMVRVGRLALESWGVCVIEPLMASLVKLLMHEIDKDRNAFCSKNSLVCSVVQSFREVDNSRRSRRAMAYTNTFEQELLASTKVHYTCRKESIPAVKRDAASYFTTVMHWVDLENKRCKVLLCEKTRHAMMTACVEILIDPHMEDLQDFMLGNDEREHLRTRYKLLHVPRDQETQKQLQVDAFKDHVQQKAIDELNQLTRDHDLPTAFVKTTLNVYNRYMCEALTNGVFRGDPMFTEVLDEVLYAAANFKNYQFLFKPAHLLAEYCDVVVRRDVQDEHETSRCYYSVHKVLNYIIDKDIFQRCYAQLLAGRLVLGQSKLEAERQMISKLHDDEEFVTQFVEMVKDASNNSKLGRQFKEFLESTEKKLHLNFSILLFKCISWPLDTLNELSCVLPRQWQKITRLYEKFYSQTYKKRRLTWLHAHSRATVQYTGLRKSYEVLMYLPQALILLQFNDKDKISLQELQSTSHIVDSKLLMEQLRPLTDAKLLVADTVGPIDEQTQFALSSTFYNKHTSFSLPPASTSAPTKPNTKDTHYDIKEERRIKIQAAIVCVMKARRVLKHDQLLHEVTEKTNRLFSATEAMISEQIKSLIDKDFLARDTEVPGQYHYVP